MALKVGELYAALGLDDKNFEKGMKNSKSTFNKASKDLVKTAGKAAVGATAALAGITAGAFAMTNKVTAAFDDISKGAQRLNVTTDFYQEMDFWASQNGLSHERMEKAIGRFNQRLGQAVNGNEKYADALSAVGINLDKVQDGSLSTEDAYTQTIQKLSQMESEQDKVNYATEIFGTRMARDLLPALADGALSIDDARKKAQELGIVMSEDALSSAVKFQDTYDQLTRTMKAVGQSVLVDLIPYFQAMMDWTLKNMPKIKDAFSTAFAFIRELFASIINRVKEFVQWFQTLYEDNEQTLSMLKDAFQTYLGFIVSYWSEVFQNAQAIIEDTLNFIVPFVQQMLTQFYEFWQENGQAILENAINVFQSIRDTIMVVFQAILTIAQEVLSVLVPFTQEKLAELREFWNENGQQIMEAVQNAFSFIQSIIEFVMPAVLAIIRTVLTAVKGVFDGALKVLMGLLQAFAGIFTGDISKLWEGIKNIFSGALQFIWNLFNLMILGRVVAIIKSFAKLGIRLIKNFAQSIANFFRGMATQIGQIIPRMWNALVNQFRAGVSQGKGIVNSLKSAVTASFKALQRQVKSIWNLIKNAIVTPIKNALKLVTNLGSSFLKAGSGLINQMVRGIKNAAGNAVNAVKGVAGKVRNFLPFSPAKEGPLSDLNKLDFGGPIKDSLKKATNGVQGQMANLLSLPQVDFAMPGVPAPNMNLTSTTSRDNTDNSPSPRPAVIKFILGGQEFEAHVDDITKTQEKKKYRLKKKRG